jgi:ribonuclease HI
VAKKSTGLCSCGEPEDLHHRWWRCPRRHALRLQALRGAKPAALAALPQCTVLYGIPVELPAVARWREGLPADAPVQMPSSRRYYPDGSCLRPRLPEVRVAAWAVVGCVNGVWWHRAGPCPGEQTIGRAELAAIVQILNGAEPGVILTDCEGVQRKCASIQCGSITREELGKGTNADLWARAWEPLRGPQGWTVQWLPSHRSLPEALAAGVSQEDWHGNDLADAAAKEEARRHDLPAEVLEQWADRQAANEAVWRLIAESQVAHLSARPRRHDGAAATQGPGEAEPQGAAQSSCSCSRASSCTVAAIRPGQGGGGRGGSSGGKACYGSCCGPGAGSFAAAGGTSGGSGRCPAGPARHHPFCATEGGGGGYRCAPCLRNGRGGVAVAPPLRAQVQHLQLELLRAYPKLVHHEWGYLKAVSRCPRV